MDFLLYQNIAVVCGNTFCERKYFFDERGKDSISTKIISRESIHHPFPWT
jgi:hypothetical protein